MTKLNGYIELKKENAGCAGKMWFAYFRGTTNRVQRDGMNIPARCKQIDLRFDILNNGYDK